MARRLDYEKPRPKRYTVHREPLRRGFRIFPAKYATTCRACGDQLAEGRTVYYAPGSGTVLCAVCGMKNVR